LPIALGILAASDQIKTDLLESHEFHGELALSGHLRSVSGGMPAALGALACGRKLVLPMENAKEAALVENVEVKAATTLLEICQYLQQQGELLIPVAPVLIDLNMGSISDMSDVRGQHRARRALEIAAAGRHNMIMVGPPGTGKSMLASRLPGILPPMTDQHALESAAVNSISHHGFDINTWKQRPFRHPHHTASGVALVGGGSNPSPGEISLAHHGVLFLDELTEFDRHVLDVLREPMETGNITISRAARQAEFPANFQLIAAMNPCPQGYSCDGKNLCQCTPEQQRRHRNRISAPLLDRIDIHIEVPKLDKSALDQDSSNNEDSLTIRKRVISAYQLQLHRAGKSNAELSSPEVDEYCQIDAAGKALLELAMDKFQLSARAYHRILKLARTIADISNSETIQKQHLTEAISYRSLDRFVNH
jgi:magnesium chelatase family protein